MAIWTLHQAEKVASFLPNVRAFDLRPPSQRQLNAAT